MCTVGQRRQMVKGIRSTCLRLFWLNQLGHAEVEQKIIAGQTTLWEQLECVGYIQVHEWDSFVITSLCGHTLGAAENRPEGWLEN